MLWEQMAHNWLEQPLATAAVALETRPNMTDIRHVLTRHALILSPMILFQV